MLDRLAANGVRTILVESPDRFARDLTVQLIGHDFPLGVDLIPTTSPDFSPRTRQQQYLSAKCSAPLPNSRKRHWSPS
jgi:hypothetical protein